MINEITCPSKDISATWVIMPPFLLFFGSEIIESIKSHRLHIIQTAAVAGSENERKLIEAWIGVEKVHAISRKNHAKA